jgi:TonB family protein
VGVANTDSVVGIEDPNFTYGYYVDRMVAIVRSHWSRPPLGSGVEGIVHFRIAKNGTVQEVRVVKSSGYNSFDLAALRAVQAAPLPPLPKSYQESSLGVNLIFR